MKSQTLKLGIVVAGLTLVSQPLFGQLVAEWKLNEGTGTTTIETLSSTVSDTYGSGVAWSATTPGPASPSSLSFGNAGGVGMNLDSAALGIGGTAAKTVVAWIKTPTTAAPEDPFFGYSPTGGSGAGQDLRFLVNAAGQLRFEANSGNFALSSVNVGNNNWWMVGLVIPANTTTAGVSFYTRQVDGIDPGTLGLGSSGGTATLTTATGSEIFLGKDGNTTTRFYSGLLDNVQVYNTALTKSELDGIFDVMMVPEPSTAALCILGALGLLSGQRLRRK